MDAKELKEQLEAAEKAKPLNFLTSHITSIIEPLNVPTLTIPNDLVLPDNIPIYHYEIDYNSIMYNPSSAVVDLHGTIKNGANLSVPVIQSSVELCVDSDPVSVPSTQFLLKKNLRYRALFLLFYYPGL